MRVFVTGANGYVGAAVSRKLKQKGCRIVALGRTDVSAQVLEAQGFEVWRGTLSDTASLMRCAKTCDAVVNAAFPFEKADIDAVFTPGPAGARKVFAALNIELRAVEALVESLSTEDKALIVFTGTGSLGDTRQYCPAEEDPVPSGSLFALRARTEVAARAAKAKGVRSVVIRAASVYGVGGSMLIPFLISSAKALGAGFCIRGAEANRWSFVHVDDLAELCWLSLDRAQPGELLHGATEESFKSVEIAQAIHGLLGATGSPRSITQDEAVSAFGDLARFWSISNSVSPGRAYGLGWRPCAPSVLEDIQFGSYRA